MSKTIPIRGTAIWPSLNIPETKFNPAGVYETKLRIDPEDEKQNAALERLRARVDEVLEQTLAEKVKELEATGKKALIAKLSTHNPISVEEDEDGAETGCFVVKVKTRASGISKKTGKPWKRSVPILNAKLEQLKNPPMIGGGSLLVCSVEPRGYYSATDKVIGVTLSLEGVQIIKLVARGERSADDLGFEEEDGDAIEDEEFTATPSSDGDDDDI